jgi:hypothetical protein
LATNRNITPFQIFKQINQPDESIAQIYFLSFKYSSTVSGILMSIIRSSITAVAASGLPLERGGSSFLCYHHSSTVKPEAATAVVELLMMGVRTPETC